MNTHKCLVSVYPRVKFVPKPGIHFALQVFGEMGLYTFGSGRVTSMMTPSSHGLSPAEHRLQAVLALLSGEKASDVSTSFSICRSDLYKFCTRPCEDWRSRRRKGTGISFQITRSSGSSVVPLPGIGRRASRSKDVRDTVRGWLSHSDSDPIHTLGVMGWRVLP
jgi:hypothetical protein